MFGHQFTAEDSIIASLESQGIRRLYSAKDVDRKKELRKVFIIYISNYNCALHAVAKYMGFGKSSTTLRTVQCAE